MRRLAGMLLCAGLGLAAMSVAAADGTSAVCVWNTAQKPQPVRVEGLGEPSAAFAPSGTPTTGDLPANSLRLLVFDLALRATTKPSARPRRPAEFGLRSVVGSEACGFARRRSAVRTSSSCAAPTGTKAARGADTKTWTALRRDTKRLRDSTRTIPNIFQSFSVPPSLRVRHSMLLQRPTMFREGRESLFVFRRTSEAFSCRTLGARSCRHGRETPKGEDARAVADDAVGIETDDVRVASIAQRAILRLCRFVVARQRSCDDAVSEA